jgi:predicted small secreted protein
MKKPVLMLMIAGLFAFASCDTNTESNTEVEMEEAGEEMENEMEEVGEDIEDGAEEVERDIEQ